MRLLNHESMSDVTSIRPGCRASHGVDVLRAFPSVLVAFSSLRLIIQSPACAKRLRKPFRDGTDPLKLPMIANWIRESFMTLSNLRCRQSRMAQELSEVRLDVELELYMWEFYGVKSAGAIRIELTPRHFTACSVRETPFNSHSSSNLTPASASACY